MPANSDFANHPGYDENGAPLRRELTVVGVPEAYKLKFDSAADLPADITNVQESEIIQITPGSGKKYAFVKFISDENVVPPAIAVNVSVNAQDKTVAAKRLNIADLTKGADLTNADSKDANLVSRDGVLFIDLSQQDVDITKIHLVGVPTGATAVTSNCYCEVILL